MIIVEGPDGGGKSTLAQYLCRETGKKYMRYPGLSSEYGPNDGVVDWWDQLLNNTPDSELDQMVFDRCFYISELLYQLVTQRPLRLSGDEMKDGIYRLRACNPVLVFCIPPWEVQHANINAAVKKLVGVTDLQLQKVAWGYEVVAAMWGDWTRVYAYNYLTHNRVDLLEALTRMEV